MGPGWRIAIGFSRVIPLRRGDLRPASYLSHTVLMRVGGSVIGGLYMIVHSQYEDRSILE